MFNVPTLPLYLCALANIGTGQGTGPVHRLYYDWNHQLLVDSEGGAMAIEPRAV